MPGLLSIAGKLQAATPGMAIAHYKAPPAAPDGIAEEARRLTRRAVEALGGMGRFVSKGQRSLGKAEYRMGSPARTGRLHEPRRRRRG